MIALRSRFQTRSINTSQSLCILIHGTWTTTGDSQTVSVVCIQHSFLADLCSLLRFSHIFILSNVRIMFILCCSQIANGRPLPERFFSPTFQLVELVTFSSSTHPQERKTLRNTDATSPLTFLMSFSFVSYIFSLVHSLFLPFFSFSSLFFFLFFLSGKD